MKQRLTITSRVLGYRSVQVLEYDHQTIAEHGQAPSYGMIRDTFGFCHNGDVCRIIERLERRGLLSRVGSGRVRRIQLALR